MMFAVQTRFSRIAHEAKRSKSKTRTAEKGRTPTDRFSLMENATNSLHHYLTHDREHLGDFLSSFSGTSVEKMVMLLNTRMPLSSPSNAYSDYTPLGYAITQNDPKAVELLLRFGACAQTAPCTSVDNITTVLSPIHLALMHQCQPTIIDVLLENGASTANIESCDGPSLFRFIAKCPSKSIISTLISKLSCLDTTDKDKRTLLHLATINYNGAAVSSVLDTRLVDVDKIDAMGKTALMYAAERNSPVIVQLLLDGGATVDATDAWGRTALHFATRRAGVKVVKMFLSSGADINVEDLKGRTPLNYAFSHDKILHSRAPLSDEDDLIDCIIEYARTPISLGEGDFLHVAFVVVRYCENETAVARFLENNRKYIAKRNNYGQTLLHIASEFNNLVAVKCLIGKRGLDADVTDSVGWQPLHCAAKGESRDTFFYLLNQRGVDINSTTPSGWTPVWIMCRNGYEKLACDVVRNGCDVHHTLTVSSLRQVNSNFSLPISLFDPKAQTDAPIQYAKSGLRRIGLAEFSKECKFAALSCVLVDVQTRGSG